jgi:hypothetical protein
MALMVWVACTAECGDEVEFTDERAPNLSCLDEAVSRSTIFYTRLPLVQTPVFTVFTSYYECISLFRCHGPVLSWASCLLKSGLKSNKATFIHKQDSGRARQAVQTPTITTHPYLNSQSCQESTSSSPTNCLSSPATTLSQSGQELASSSSNSSRIFSAFLASPFSFFFDWAEPAVQGWNGNAIALARASGIMRSLSWLAAAKTFRPIAAGASGAANKSGFVSRAVLYSEFGRPFAC